MVTKLPEIHAKGFEILEKFCHTNGSFCQSPDSRRIMFTIKYPLPGGKPMHTSNETTVFHKSNDNLSRQIGRHFFNVLHGIEKEKFGASIGTVSSIVAT